MTYKQVETSREVRLWLTQIVLPIVGVAMLVPEARQAVWKKSSKLIRTSKPRSRKTKRLGLYTGPFLFRDKNSVFNERS